MVLLVMWYTGGVAFAKRWARPRLSAVRVQERRTAPAQGVACGIGTCLQYYDDDDNVLLLLLLPPPLAEVLITTHRDFCVLDQQTNGYFAEVPPEQRLH